MPQRSAPQERAVSLKPGSGALLIREPDKAPGAQIV